MTVISEEIMDGTFDFEGRLFDWGDALVCAASDEPLSLAFENMTTCL